jgi:hypothetical protein
MRGRQMKTQGVAVLSKNNTFERAGKEDAEENGKDKFQVWIIYRQYEPKL